jgi:heme-degrading monooxygenase HmoA
MIAVIFEVLPAESRREAYISLAAELAPKLQDVDGFLSIERFQSLSDPEKILSLSFWRDEDAVANWRNFELHRCAQITGRKSIFSDYRLRIASVVRDYGMHARSEAPDDSKRIHG